MTLPIARDLVPLGIRVNTIAADRDGTGYYADISTVPNVSAEKLEDCATVQQLIRCTPTISLHIPWDRPDDLAEGAREHGLLVARLVCRGHR